MAVSDEEKLVTHLQTLKFPSLSYLIAVCLSAVFTALVLWKAWSWFRTAYILQSTFPSPPMVSLIPGHAPIFATSQPHRVWAEWSERLGGDFYARLGPVHVSFLISAKI